MTQADPNPMEARIREELSSDEVTQAVGRAADISDTSLQAQGDEVHLVVTDTVAARSSRFSWEVDDVPLPPAHRRSLTIVPRRIS